jgi:hypothetical protein
MNAAEMDNLARATIKECVKVEVRQLVQENLAAVLTELLAELVEAPRTSPTDNQMP